MVNEADFVGDSVLKDAPKLIKTVLLRTAFNLANEELLKDELSELSILFVAFNHEQSLCRREVAVEDV